jgi:hypothetical protein
VYHILYLSNPRETGLHAVRKWSAGRDGGNRVAVKQVRDPALTRALTNTQCNATDGADSLESVSFHLANAPPAFALTETQQWDHLEMFFIRQYDGMFIPFARSVRL